jgi:hypothetical protein
MNGALPSLITMYRILVFVTTTLAALTLNSCLGLGNPFKRPGPIVEESPRARNPAPEPNLQNPADLEAPVSQANAYYEIGSASALFFVSRPTSARVDRVPDDILRRGTVVQVLVPKSGTSWTRVRLEDAQTGYIPSVDIKVVPASLRPSGFSSNPSRIDTGPLKLPAVPDTPEPPKLEPINDIDLDLPGTEPATPTLSPSPSTLPDAPDSIKIDEIPGI